MLTGTFALIVGKNRKTEDQNLKVETGSKVKLGLLDAKVGSTDEEGDPNYQMIELTAAKPFDSVAKIEFLDSKDAVIESRFSGSGNFSGDGKETYMQAYYVNSGRSH